MCVPRTRPNTHYGDINPYEDKNAFTSQNDLYGSKLNFYMNLLN